jgi:CubicO group peptidase (beta-lactamase class C family)
VSEPGSGRVRRLLVAGIGVVLLLAAGILVWRMTAAAPAPLPPVEWPTAAPETEGLNEAALTSLSEDLAERGTKVFLVARRGHLVYEWYARYFDERQLHYTASMVKGTAATPVLVAAMQRGLLSLDDRVAEWVPEWEADPERSRITIAHLAFHNSGLEDVDFDLGQQNALTGWKQRYYDHPAERYRLAIDSASLLFSPGSGYSYSGVGYYVLSYVVSRALQAEPTPDIPSLLDEAIYGPIGIPTDAWSIGYDRVDMVDGLRLTHFGSGGYITGRAAARIGQLVLQRGCWEGRQILDPELLDTMLGRREEAPVPPGDSADADLVPADGWWPASASIGGWWTDLDGAWPPGARGAVAALGYGHQIVWVDPKLDLVVVRLGRDLTEGREAFDVALARHFVTPLYEALTGAEPLDASDAAHDVHGIEGCREGAHTDEGLNG